MERREKQTEDGGLVNDRTRIYKDKIFERTKKKHQVDV